MMPAKCQDTPNNFFFSFFKSGDTKALPEIPPNKNLHLTGQNYIT